MTFKPDNILVDTDSDGHTVYASESGERVRILKDSITHDGNRLTTMEVRFYRGVLAEFNTHRAFSRNSASSRAIPVMKMIQMVLDDPYVPSYWGAYQKGMQAHYELKNPIKKRLNWLQARDNAVQSALKLIFGDLYTEYLQNYISLEVAVDVLKCHPIPDDAPHKQIVNRILEPFMWHTVIVSATDYANFFDLRNHEDADPAIHQIAYLMQVAYEASLPEPIEFGSWHLPLMKEEEIKELDTSKAVMISAARCARVSYLTHDGKRDYDKDLELYSRLITGKPHLSPLEHVAVPRSDGKFKSNFDGWVQLRNVYTWR